MIRICIALLCLTFAPLPAAAQGNDRAEELLRWFPQGTYMMIAHKDVSALSQGKAWPLYREYFEPEEKGARENDGKNGEKGFPAPKAQVFLGNGPEMMPLNLPDLLKQHVVSSTIGDFLSLVDAQEDSNSVHALEIAPKGGEEKGNQMRVGVFITRNQSLEVHRLDDPETAFALAIEKKVLADTGRKIAARPVYSIQSVGHNGERNSERYAWITEDGTLLVAGSVENLHKMVLAGTGKTMGLIDDVDYTELVQLIPDLGPKWSASAVSRTNAQIAEMASSGDISDEAVEKMQERAENNPLMRISSWTVTDAITNREITVYRTSAQAEAAYQTGSNGSDRMNPLSGNSPEWDAYQSLLQQKRQRSLDGYLVSTTMVYDKDLLKAEKAANEALAAMLQKNNGMLQFQSPDGRKQIVIQTKEGDAKSGKIQEKKKQ